MIKEKASADTSDALTSQGGERVKPDSIAPSGGTVGAEKKLLTPKDLEREYGIPEGTQAVWRCTKRYPGFQWIRLGGRIRYRRADIEAFLTSRLVRSTPLEASTTA